MYWASAEPIKPPIIAPRTTIRFQRCDFQSNLKKSEVLSAPQIVQSVRKLDYMPNFFSTIISKNITKAIRKPEIYQGQGLRIISILVKLFAVLEQLKLYKKSVQNFEHFFSY